MLYLYNLALISLISLERDEELQLGITNALVPKDKEESR
jgi:hypothetical protein